MTKIEKEIKKLSDQRSELHKGYTQAKAAADEYRASLGAAVLAGGDAKEISSEQARRDGLAETLQAGIQEADKLLSALGADLRAEQAQAAVKEIEKRAGQAEALFVELLGFLVSAGQMLDVVEENYKSAGKLATENKLPTPRPGIFYVQFDNDLRTALANYMRFIEKAYPTVFADIAEGRLPRKKAVITRGIHTPEKESDFARALRNPTLVRPASGPFVGRQDSPLSYPGAPNPETPNSLRRG